MRGQIDIESFVLVGTINVPDSKDGTATDSDVVAGKVYYVNGERRTGTLEDAEDMEF